LLDVPTHFVVRLFPFCSAVYAFVYIFVVPSPDRVPRCSLLFSLTFDVCSFVTRYVHSPTHLVYFPRAFRCCGCYTPLRLPHVIFVAVHCSLRFVYFWYAVAAFHRTHHLLPLTFTFDSQLPRLRSGRASTGSPHWFVTFSSAYSRFAVLTFGLTRCAMRFTQFSSVQFFLWFWFSHFFTTLHIPPATSVFLRSTHLTFPLRTLHAVCCPACTHSAAHPCTHRSAHPPPHLHTYTGCSPGRLLRLRLICDSLLRFPFVKRFVCVARW